jgi:hypothetical protein
VLYLPRSHRSFEPIVEGLLSQGGMRLILLDQRFHGESDKVRIFDIEVFAARLCERVCSGSERFSGFASPPVVG